MVIKVNQKKGRKERKKERKERKIERSLNENYDFDFRLLVFTLKLEWKRYLIFQQQKQKRKVRLPVRKRYQIQNLYENQKLIFNY